MREMELREAERFLREGQGSDIAKAITVCFFRENVIGNGPLVRYDYTGVPFEEMQDLARIVDEHLAGELV
jgi:hypothetical protein